MFLFGRKKKPLIDAAAQERVMQAIRDAEQKTTGEIRVYLEPHCSYMDAIDRAREVFDQLQMEHTERRNAVLVYMAIDDRQFAIFGDKEIYEKAGGPAFWQSAADKMKAQLRAGMLVEGLCNCVTELGNALAAHFPYDPTVTKNELPDEIVFGK
jgi:uncharacterized membrane protein